MDNPGGAAHKQDDAASAVAELLDAGRSLHAAKLVVAIVAAAGRVGLAEATLWLADVQQRVLVPYDGMDKGPGDGLTVDGTLAGRAYQESRAQRSDAGTDGVGEAVWIPLMDGTDRLGVLGGQVERWSDDLAIDLGMLARLAGRLLGADQRHSDAVARTRRLRPTSVAAEVQWALLPPLACVDGATTICGALEPAYDISGDTFDYAVADGPACFGVFDAMGHGLSAAMMASVAVGAYRQARRVGLDLEGCAASIDEAVGGQFPDSFVTGVLAEFDGASGQLSYLVAGHHPAVVLRAGRVVRHLDDAGRLPFGLGSAFGPTGGGAPHGRVGAERLEPGDRVLLYTDGVIEARDPGGTFFGLDRLEELLVHEDASGNDGRETLRRLIHAVLGHQAGLLQDDAMLLMLQWQPI
ncbi:MAG: PP2C family protein-serine/threonine phosphatase [Acidimicrobiales bacterium]